MTPPLLKATDLTKVFLLKSGLFSRKTSHAAIKAINLELAHRERIGIVGESGSGKSTLGRLLLGLAHPTLGDVSYEGLSHADRRSRDWSAFRRQTSLVQQNPQAALNPQISIGNQVAEPVLVHKVGDQTVARERAAAILERVGLSSALMGRFPHQLSGGQRQRVVMARALILDPKLVIFDEAVSALDVSVQAQVVAQLRSLWQELDLAYVFITHDLRIVRYVVDRIAVMYLGRVVETGGIEAIYEWPRHPYTKALLAAVPVMDPRIRNIPAPIQGELDIAKLSLGCAFRSRCPFAVDKCAAEVPPLRMVGQQQVACHRAEELPRTVAGQMESAR